MEVPLLEVLLHTDGSVTRILERFFEEVTIDPLETRQLEVEGREARLLGVPDGDTVYVRRVVIKVDGRPAILATSLARPDNLPGRLRRLVLQSRKPLGKMIEELELETRREILRVEEARPSPEDEEILGVSAPKIPWREYLVYHRRTPMLLIRERFNPEVLGREG
ncbi:chorismate--pyruvate lyase family protein [Methanopyrus sp.]